MNPTISAPDLQSALANGQRLNLIDVRSAQEFAEGHVPRSVNIPLEELDQRLDDLDPREPSVLICATGRRAEIARENLSASRSDLLVLDGGVEAWGKRGGKVVGRGAARLPLMRQVHLVVGPLALLGGLSAIFVDPRWAALPALLGAGLTLAGATGWCGLGILLSKMPWNQARASGSCTPRTPNQA